MNLKSKSLLFLGFLALILTVLHCEKEVIKVKDDVTAPVITIVPEVSVSDSSALIQWITDEPCSVQVKYWINATTDTLLESDDEFRQNHSVLLSGLIPLTTYSFYTINYDIAANSTASAAASFSTVVDTSNLIVYGWLAFEGQNYAEAIGYFTNTDNIRSASQAIVADNLKEKISIKRAAEKLVSVYESIFRKKDGR